MQSKKHFFTLAMLASLVVLGVSIFSPNVAYAINEDRDPSSPYITGLWNTGRDTQANGGGLLNLPPREVPGGSGNYDNSNSGAPYPAATNPGTPAYATPHYDHEVQDPHWRLVRVDTPNGQNPCQGGPFPRPATTVEAPDYDRFAPDWVWWRSTIETFRAMGNTGARWIGARSDSWHDGTFPYNTGCTDPSQDGVGTDSWPVWTYELVGGFYVGSCVDSRTPQFNLRFASDNNFRMLVNNKQIIPDPAVGPWIGQSNIVTQTSPVSPGVFLPNQVNTLQVQVQSGILLTGFAISWDNPTIDCITDDPYMKVYGNDVKVGGGLKPSCSPTNDKATILTFADRAKGASSGQEDWHGSSTQFAAYALGEILEFFSAGQNSPRTNTPPGSNQARPIIDLTFGNYDPGATAGSQGFTDSALYDLRKVVGYGGNSGMVSCIEDYYGSMVTNGATNFAGNTMPARTITSPVAEYHDGDLYINGDINLGGTWTDAAGKTNIPSYYLAVKGNIYISNQVGNLDGVFIAQEDPNRANTGRIYTCATGVGAIPATNDLYNVCRQKRLYINGAFVAKQVKFLRSIDTLSNGTPNETAAASRAAEIFNFSPETYLAQPNAALRTGSQKAQYDFITSLPPIL